MCLVPLYCYADEQSDHISTQVFLISIVEFILFLTSLASIKQYFWKTNYNHTPFHIFNIVFAIVFYSISFTFLVKHKSFWEGFEHLSDGECIKRVILSKEPFAIIKKLIWVAFILNITYIIRYSKDYFREV